MANSILDNNWEMNRKLKTRGLSRMTHTEWLLYYNVVPLSWMTVQWTCVVHDAHTAMHCHFRITFTYTYKLHNYLRQRCSFPAKTQEKVLTYAILWREDWRGTQTSGQLPVILSLRQCSWISLIRCSFRHDFSHRACDIMRGRGCLERDHAYMFQRNMLIV